MALTGIDYKNNLVVKPDVAKGTESFTAGQQKTIDTGLDHISMFYYVSTGTGSSTRWHTISYTDYTPNKHRVEGGSAPTQTIQTQWLTIGENADGWNSAIKSINGGQITIQANTSEGEEGTWMAM